MLETLVIKNVALIECAEINFTKGLNVLSGETGAGKSVIIESLNFVLGAKADKTLIRRFQSEQRSPLPGGWHTLCPCRQDPCRYPHGSLR